ncbi:hypothetical protein VD0002_g8327 [Verticillium dahliae]|uniref:Uncharacterized protein n=1 Tax=Verticillium dahliae TaxID=27337 RepID=A0AA45AN47_VERDA|nr:RNase P subunit p30 [Verticillium dahliae]PNH32391.1 hypothetical protein BJF96_g4297 [Verticillium dahliae]PNH48644.1 hypothetical protein VD0003_g8487 [Verticillium dahliae]PNH59224.1 hypothetical protein VD0002_g8327 [Verticillium dahliae]
MLYDLSIPWSPSTTTRDLENTITFSAALGYNVIALNHIIDGPLPSTITNPLPKLDAGASSTSSSSSSSSSARAPHPANPTTPRRPTILHRATLVYSDPAQNHRMPSLAAAYDLLAVRPTNERAFTSACLALADPALISLDLTARFDFHFRPKPCMAAVARGLRFEICYAHALRAGGGPDAAQARAAFVANFQALARATRGRGLVVSSAAQSALQLRGPADVVNLLAVWGLGAERGMEALRGNPRGVVVNEGLKRTSYKSVINVVETAARAGDTEMKDIGADTGTGAPQEGGKKGKNAAKRKNDESGAAVGAEQPQVISKRQAKKLRLAQKEAAAAPAPRATTEKL